MSKVGVKLKANDLE